MSTFRQNSFWEVPNGELPEAVTLPIAVPTEPMRTTSRLREVSQRLASLATEVDFTDQYDIADELRQIVDELDDVIGYAP
jgi:hypothetical protein